MLHAIPPTVPAIVAPATKSSRDEFPGNRCAPRPDGKGQRCTAQTRLYWVTLSRPVVDPEHGEMVETDIIDAEITEGYIPGEGGEVKRLTALVAAAMPGWTITGLQLADAPDVEF